MKQCDHYSRQEIHEPFDEPWHAEVFAVTVHLSDQNLFSWAEWTDAIGEKISTAKLRRSIDGSDDYYNFVLNTRSESEFNLFYNNIKSNLNILINNEYMDRD